MEKSCSLLAHFDNGETPTLFSEIKQSLESNDVTSKNEGLQNAIMLLLNDADAAAPHLFITVILRLKVAVNTVLQDEREILGHIIKSTTNMKCLTPTSALDGECGFLSANLYAKSVFGEDALANVSIEKQADGKLSGYITVRSKTEGIALSLGDKITLKQNGTTQ